MEEVKRVVFTVFLLFVGILFSFGGDGQIDIATLPFTISSPGSYIVVKDLSISNPDVNGINIQVSNVTIDLNGHTLTGAGKEVGTIGCGIAILGSLMNITVKNGTIREWRGDGINATYARNCRFINLQCYRNGGHGIASGNSSLVTNCCCFYNGGNGIFADDGSIVINNTATSNTAYGIWAEDTSTIEENTCSHNGSGGIRAGAGCTVVRNSTIINYGTGIKTTNGSLIKENVCYSNKSDGIKSISECFIMGNYCSKSGFEGDGAGIHTTSYDNNIEFNMVIENDRGIQVDHSGNYIASNYASDNGTDYVIVSGNTEGTGDLANVSY